MRTSAIAAGFFAAFCALPIAGISLAQDGEHRKLVVTSTEDAVQLDGVFARAIASVYAEFVHEISSPGYMPSSVAEYYAKPENYIVVVEPADHEMELQIAFIPDPRNNISLAVDGGGVTFTIDASTYRILRREHGM